MSKLNYKQMEEKNDKENEIDLKKYLDSKDFTILKKLVDGIEDKVYTRDEYDSILFSLMEYYTDDDEQRRFKKEDFIYLKSLDEKGVDREEFNKLMFKVMEIRYPRNIN